MRLHLCLLADNFPFLLMLTLRSVSGRSKFIRFVPKHMFYIELKNAYLKTKRHGFQKYTTRYKLTKTSVDTTPQNHQNIIEWSNPYSKNFSNSRNSLNSHEKNNVLFCRNTVKSFCSWRNKSNKNSTTTSTLSRRNEVLSNTKSNVNFLSKYPKKNIFFFFFIRPP